MRIFRSVTLFLLSIFLLGLITANAQERPFAWEENETAALDPVVTVYLAPCDAWFAAVEKIMSNTEGIDPKMAIEYLGAKSMVQSQIKEFGIDNSKPIGFSLLADEELFYLLGGFSSAVEKPDPIHENKLEIDSISENVLSLGTYLGEKPVYVKRETIDVFSFFGPSVGFRKNDQVFLVSDGIQKRVAKDPKKYFPAQSEEGVLYEQTLTLKGEQKPILKTLARIPLQLGRLYSGLLETENEEAAVMCDGIFKIVRYLEKTCMEIDSFSRTIKVDPKNGDFIFCDTLEVTPDGNLAKCFELQKNHKTSLLGFYQPEESIAAGILSCEISPDKADCVKTVLDLIRYVMENADNMNSRNVYLLYGTEMEESESAEEESDEPVIDEPTEGYGYSPYTNFTSDEEVEDETEVIEIVEINSFPIDPTDPMVLECVEKVFEGIERFVQAGKIEAAFTVKNDGTVMAGLRIIDGGKISDKLDELKEQLGENPFSAVFLQFLKMNVAESDGIKFTHLNVPFSTLLDLSGMDEDSREKLHFLEEKSGNLVLGIHENYIGFIFKIDGEHEAMQKSLLDAFAGIKNPQPLPETTFVVSMHEIAKIWKPLLEHILEVSDNIDDPESAQLALDWMQALIDAGPDAKISCGTKYDGNRMRTQLKVSAKAIAPSVVLIYKSAKKNQ